MTAPQLNRFLFFFLSAVPMVMSAQSGLFSDSLYVRDGLITSEGGMIVRIYPWSGGHLAKYDAALSPQWRNDYQTMSVTSGVQFTGMDVLPEGRAVIVGRGATTTTGSFPDTETSCRIVVCRISPDGTVYDAKDHRVITEGGTADPVSDYGYPISAGTSGDMFIGLRYYGDGQLGCMIMKVNADGTFGWCVRSPSPGVLMGRLSPDGEGGCYAVVQGLFASDPINIIHLAADGGTLWSTLIARPGYMYSGQFNFYRRSDGGLFVIGVSDNNLARLRFSPDGVLEEHLLVAVSPSSPSNIIDGVVGSAMSEEGELTVFMTTGSLPYRAIRFDASEAVIGAWTTPVTVDGTWTSTFYINYVQQQGAMLTAVGSIWQEESTFGFTSTHGVVVSSPVDLSGFCDVSPLQFAQIALPLAEVEVTDGEPFTSIAYGGATDLAVTIIPYAPDQPEELCAPLGTGGQNADPVQMMVYPNPVAVLGRLRVEATEGQELCVLDALGHVVHSESFSAPVLEFTANFASGVYAIAVRNTKGVVGVSRLVVE